MTDAGWENHGFLLRSQKIFLKIGIIYVMGIVLLSFPFFQRQALYLHNVHWPLFARFDAPHYHGLAPFKTLNLMLTTPDNVRIGAWFVLSDSAYKSSGAFNRTQPPNPTEVTRALENFPTVLFFHGNAASRAVKYRVQFYGANLLVIDYRGFGDSESFPSEAGLNIDARTSWDWLVENGADPKDIVILGQSLGTGVATKLATQLTEEGITPRGLVLTAPFSAVTKLLETYSFGGYIPLFRPLQIFPYASYIIERFTHTRYETISLISDVRCPILIVHAKDDGTIPFSHSTDLFLRLLDPQLPPWPPFMLENDAKLGALSWTSEQLAQVTRTAEERVVVTNKIVTTFLAGPEDAPFGAVKTFNRRLEEGGQRVVFLETEKGGHTEIVRSEGVIDYIGWTMWIQDYV
ncbi:hypothetical protein FRB95_007317 [Tulasnella sp. JGI-2019a]|nr:hypothetical protein FRB95_007317 [Tulasnella sp. JGI-2019a]